MRHPQVGAPEPEHGVRAIRAGRGTDCAVGFDPAGRAGAMSHDTESGHP